MFLDLNSDGYWDSGPCCTSCKALILPEHKTEDVRFEHDSVHRLHEMNGLYHAECAKPYLSLARALGALGRSFF